MCLQRSRMFSCLITGVILVSLNLSASAELAQTATALRQETALKFAPADVSFCSVMLRNRQQFHRVANSQAIKKLMSIPLAKQYLGMAMSEWENPSDGDFEQFKEFLVENEVLELLADGASQEIFIYGGDGYGRALRLFNQFNNQMNAAQFSQLGIGGGGASPEEFIVKWLEENVDQINVVDTVVGMKLTNTDRARTLIERIEGLIQRLANDEPDAAFLKTAMKRRTIVGSEFLTLNLDGQMVPWDEMDIDDGDFDPERIEKLLARLKKKTAMIALGVHDGYLLMVAGKDDSVLTQLGKKALLIDDPKMAPLLKVADRPITQVGFVNEKFMKEASATEQQLDQMATMGESLLKIGNLEAEAIQRIKADIDELSADIKKVIPTPGAVVGFNYMTPDGYEGYQYNWAEDRVYDASQKLSILDHVGSDPILFVAGRAKHNPDGYDTLVKWLGKGYAYFQEFAVPAMDQQQRDQYEEAQRRFSPLVARMDKVNREMLIPAFADGQGAVVIDAKQKSTQWQTFMPPSEVELAMLEIGLVYGVSDEALLMEGFAEYFEIAQAIITNLSEMEPNQIPPVQIPAAETKEVSGGTIHYYRLPAMAGLDRAVAPNTGISDQFFVMSLMPKMTQRLLQSSEVEPLGPLAKMGQPLSMAWQFRVADLVSAVEPWVGYGMSLSDMDADEAEAMSAQVSSILEVVRCFKTAAGVGYVEDGVSVTHYASHFEDLE